MGLSNMLSRSVDHIPWAWRDRIRRIPLVAGFQRWLVSRFLHGSEFVHRISAGPAKGLNFRIKLPDDKLYWTGTWEQDVTTVIAAQVPAGSVCCDIGSHRGFMGGIMARNGARLVYCFEPDPDNFDSIVELAALNSDVELRPLNLAVGATDGDMEFMRMPESSMGKLASSSFQSTETSRDVLRVKVRSLDSLVTDSTIEPPAFIKIDIEGAEFDALTGARQLITNNSPAFLIELHSFDLLQRCKAFLEEAGYSIRFVQQGAWPCSQASFRVCHMLAVKT